MLHRNMQERPEELTRELQVDQSHFCPWESHGTNPLGVHFWAHEKEVIGISQHGFTKVLQSEGVDNQAVKKY